MSRRDDDILNAFDSTPFRVEWTPDGHATEESVYAWLDGALVAHDSDAIERHVGQCLQCQAAVAEARGYIAASARIMNAADLPPRNVIPRDDVTRTAARIVALADRTSVNGSARNSATTIAHTMPDARRRFTHPFVRAAAALLVVASGFYLGTLNDKPAPSTQPDLAATPPAALPPRIASVRTDSASPTIKNETRDRPVTAAKAIAPVQERPVTAPKIAERKTGEVQNLAGISIQAQMPPREEVKLSFTAVVVRATGQRQVVGTVRDRATSAPLDAVNIMVPGTALTASTDANGAFSLRDVPASAQYLRVRRLGYEGTDVELSGLAADSAQLSIALAGAQLRLSEVTVTGLPNQRAKRAKSCFIAEALYSGDHTPIVQGIEASSDDGRTYVAIIVGWQFGDASTSITLETDSANVLRGSVRNSSARLELELLRQADGWFSTVREYRGSNVRSENIRFKSGSVPRGCS